MPCRDKGKMYDSKAHTSRDVSLALDRESRYSKAVEQVWALSVVHKAPRNPYFNPYYYQGP